jgi:hypothetical protein
MVTLMKSIYPRLKENVFPIIKNRGDVLALLFILTTVALFMGRVVFLGRVLVPLDIVYGNRPWKSESTVDFNPVWNPFLSDVVWQFYPMAVAADELRTQGNYFWDPYPMSGMPSMARGEMFTNPIYFFLSQFLSTGSAMSWAAVLALGIGGVFSYLLLRELKCGILGSLIGAMTFIFNGYLINWLSFPNMTGTMVWIPAIAWAIVRAVQRQDWRWCILGAFGFMIQILMGSILWPFYTAITVMLLLLAQTIPQFFLRKMLREALRPLWYGILTFGVGSALAAPSLFLTIQLFFHTARNTQIGATTAMNFSWEFIRLFAPTIYGNALRGDDYRTTFNFVETNLYFGIIPLFFLVAGLGTKRRTLVWPVFGLGLAAWLAVYNIFPFRQLISRAYPLFLNTFPGRIFFVVAFCWSIVIAFGVNELVNQTSTRKPKLLGVTALLLTLAFLGLSGIVTYTQTHPVLADPSLATQVAAISVKSLLLTSVLLGLTTLIFWLWPYLRRFPSLLQGTLVTILLIDLFFAGINFNPAWDESLAFPETDSIKYLLSRQENRLGQARIATLASADILPGMTGEIYGLEFLSGYSSWVLKRYAMYIRLTQPDITLNNLYLTKCCSPLLDILNARYIYTPPREPLVNADALELIYDGSVKIYENKAAFPRAWIVHQITSIPFSALDLAQEYLLNPAFAPALEAVVETDRNLPAPDSPTAQPTRADITLYEPEHVVIQAELSQAGLLILSDNMYPGWKAYVDGEQVPIYYTNLFMRGVFLDPGIHQVEFVYRSELFLVGVAVTAVTLFFIILMLWRVKGRNKLNYSPA